MTLNIEITPYCEIDGIRTLRDSDVKALFYKMQRDGTVPMVFYDGSIIDADGFLGEMKSSRNHLYVVFLDGAEAGIVFLNRFDGRTAHFNWAIFSEFWGMARKKEFARQVRDMLLYQKDPMGEGYVYDAFLGLMLPENIRAIEFAKECGGAKVVGEIPNGIYNFYKEESQPAILVCYPRAKEQP